MVLPPTLAAALSVEHAQVYGNARIPREAEQIELLGWILNDQISGTQPVTRNGGGLRLKPPALQRPPRLDAELPQEPDKVTEATEITHDAGGGVRLPHNSVVRVKQSHRLDQTPAAEVV